MNPTPRRQEPSRPLPPVADPRSAQAAALRARQDAEAEDLVRFCFNSEPQRRSGLSLRGRFSSAISLLALALAVVQGLSAQSLDLAEVARVESSGVTVGALFPALAGEPAAGLKLADAPEFGRTFTWDRKAVEALLREKAPELATTNWTGAAVVRVERKSRQLGEDELRKWLTAALQEEHVRDRGELELAVVREWKPVAVPDEPLTLRVVNLPLAGVNSSFVARIAVDCHDVCIGIWPVVLQARIWRDVLIAGTHLKRGQPLSASDVRTERRDLLLTRDYVTPEALESGDYELVSNLGLGQLVTGRCLRVRPVITRGTVVDALVADGAMTISLKVEALEDAVLGQNLRVKNLKTRREMLGKVQNEQTIVLYL